MKLVPDAIGRKVAGLALQGQKHSPSLLFGAGVASMVGSTVLACRATLKLEGTLDEIERNKDQAHQVSAHVNSAEYTGDQTYSDADMKRDLTIITTRGVVSIAKLYAPSVLLGGIGVVCLTKSHSILRDRNTALTAAYVAIDRAFAEYRGRVIEKHGEEQDRYFRYGAEEVDIIDVDTGKIVSTVRTAPEGLPSGYARWFDAESSLNFNAPPNENYNWVFLRQQQNWANDLLRSRGHLFLNEVYGMLGMDHTSAGAIVGWVYDRENDQGDNFVSFICLEGDGHPVDFFNGREGAVLLDFNVDGPIWQLLDERGDRHE